MPKWFMKQMTEAFLSKNIYQIKILNQCWFFYREKNTNSS
ncbi:cortex morphogenetic protein CmpA [Radiobacillus deserti]|uniref:Cortex morphogenetic protein CmpA n=1 Tax=Radiobacillus deserti TaxID=2594883 RepID=A0A516KCR7_9BACI|nr:cortex morphogenetic protein CmpA [Radiobacillus deserti]QDP39160.1 cortex morphogenetic protein CmpA [Radiobacillus deserti]